MQILNSTRKTVIAQKGCLAETVLSRLTGLLGRRSLDSDEALVLTDCRSIHMFFMRFAIDAIFLSSDKKVLRLVLGLKPFQVSPYVFKAYYVVEGPVGMIERSNVAIGDELVFIG